MRRPLLTVLAGLPGAGKSTAAEALVAATGAALIARDELARAMRTALHPGVENRIMEAAVRQLLAHGVDVVVDAWNLDPGDRATWDAVAAQTGASLRWTLLTTPVEECVRRDAERAHPNGETRVRAAAAAYAGQLAA